MVTSFASPTIINRPAVVAPAATVQQGTVFGATASPPQSCLSNATLTVAMRNVDGARIRMARLHTVRNRLLAVAVPAVATAVVFVFAGVPVQALAPATFFIGTLGSLVVVQMKISDAKK